MYTDKCTELGNGRKGRRGAAGAGGGIYTPDFAFLQSACFHSSATSSCLSHIALKRQGTAIGLYQPYREFVSFFLPTVT